MKEHYMLRIYLFLLMYLLCSTYARSQKKNERPNIIIIVSDDQGWGDVGFNGGCDIPTPNLDRLAKEGISFSAGYANHSYCSPSRAGLLTGRYQQRFGHENNTPYSQADPDAGLPLNETMLSEILKENGYKTCAIGKWHLGDDKKFWPINRGFDYWYGFFGGGMSFWGDTGNRSALHGVLRNGIPVPLEEQTHLTDDFTREAVNYIEQQKDGGPYFMYLAYNAPHAPIHATSEHLKLTDHIEDGKRSAYGAMVAGMDAGIGKVIDKLKATGQLENTLVFFSSDNGAHIHGASSYPYRGHKGMLFEGGIRVPFLVYWGTRIQQNLRYEKPIIALDIFPTALAAASIRIPKELRLDGVNLLPYLQGKNDGDPHDDLYWRYSDGAGYAVRKGKYKMVMSGYKQKHFLFDLEKDPYEQTDLSKEQPEKLKELIALYNEWTKGTIPAKWYDPHPENVLKEEKNRLAIRAQASAGEKKKKQTLIKN